MIQGAQWKKTHFCCWIVQESSKSGRLVGMGWYGLSPRTSLHERIWTSEKQKFWKLGTELNQQLTKNKLQAYLANVVDWLVGGPPLKQF